MSVATKPSQYVVAAGDTLGAIARRFGYSVDELVVANEIPDPDRIAVGQMLQLPLEEKGELGRAEEGGTQGSLRILFVDKLLRAISGLEFVLESNRGVILEGITNADGLSESVSELRVGEELSLLVKRARGGFKKVISTTFGGGERILTAYSPALLVKSRTEAHEGIPGNDRSAEGHPLIRIDAGEVALDFLDFDSGERIEESDYEVAASLLGCEVAPSRRWLKPKPAQWEASFNCGAGIPCLRSSMSATTFTGSRVEPLMRPIPTFPTVVPGQVARGATNIGNF